MDIQSIIQNGVESAIGRDAIVYALAAIGLNVHFGYTGLLNFGQAGFMAVGAYGVGIAVVEFGWPLWAGVLLGLGAAVVLALLLGLPTLRLRADYLAIVTIAAGEILRFTFRAAVLRDFTGGSNGINGFADDFYKPNPLGPGDYGFWRIRFSQNQLWVILVGWTLVALAVLLVWALMRSPWGRVLRAIREDEDAVRSLGKNVYSYKMQSLILGGVIGAVAGMMLSISAQSVQPDNYGTATTFFAYVVLILGGTARILGPVIGSIVFWGFLSVTETVLRQAVDQKYIPNSIMDSVQVGQVRFMLVGLGLILLLVFRPQGIFGDKQEIALAAR
jgi:branched-chain amino acid transport system permease protein